MLERYVPHVQGGAGTLTFAGGHRVDFDGFADILAGHASQGKIVFVQSTSKAKITAHLRKYRRDEKIREAILYWLGFPNVEVWILGAHQPGGYGTRWKMAERIITAEDLEEARF
jgi:hypothetical protein